MTNHGRLAPDSLDSIAVIVDLVRTGEATSRSEIMRITGLSKAIVMQRVGELVARGFLSETIAPSTGGRPPKRLRFRSDAGHLLVADIGVTSIDAAIADLSGTLITHVSEVADVAAGPDVVLSRLEAILAQMITESKPPGDAWGLGIGVPGPVEFRTGHPMSPPIMPGWDRYPIRERLMRSQGVPVWVDNDVNIMALGEWRYGAARGHDNVIFVKVGTGIGSGIIADGVIHRGAQGSAGDIGHMQVRDDVTVMCRCGKSGCLESFAGGGAIARDGLELANSGQSKQLARIAKQFGSVDARAVMEAATMGDASSVELLDRSARLIGLTLSGLVNFFNPSLVVIGGGIANTGDAYLARIRQMIYGRSAPLATRDLEVQLSQLGDRAGVMGAASMVLDQLFSAAHLGRWIDSGRPAGLQIVAA